MPSLRKQIAFEVYTALHTGPCIIDLMEKGLIRISVGTEIPSAASLPFHLLKYPAGRFVYAGNETVYAMSDVIDESPYAVVTPNEAEHFISKGKAYRVSGKITNLTAYGETYMLIKVPSGTFPHMQRPRINAGGGDVDTLLLDSPTTTADGTLIPALNLDRNSDNTANMEVYVGPTVTAAGTSMDTQWIPPTAAGIGQRLDDAGGLATGEDWVLKENTNYLLYITNNSSIPISLWFELLWYEL